MTDVIINEVTETVLIETLGATEVVDSTGDAQVLEVAGQQGVPGPPGPPGQPGAPSGSALLLPTLVPLGGHRAVRMQAGYLVYADKDQLGDAVTVLGITQGAATAGSQASVQTIGLMTESTWAWTPDMPVFVGANGVLTQVQPASGFSLVAGVALTPQQIHIGLKMPIILE